MPRKLGINLGAKCLLAAAVLALAGRAGAHPTPKPTATATAQPKSHAFEQACIDLIHGKAPGGEQAIDALRDACAELMKARSEDSRRAEQQAQARAQEPQAEAGRGTAPVESGEGVLAAFTQASSEAVGGRPRGMMGMNRSGQPFASTFLTNPVGWFTGVGVNGEVVHAFKPQFSWVAGAHYSQSAATDRTLYTLGLVAGMDWFLLGRNNEGLRLGPRFDFSFGRETSDSTTTNGRLGLAGELGYNFVALNGITGAAAFGIGGRVAGDKNEELSSGAGGELGPYVKLGFGYSW